MPPILNFRRKFMVFNSMTGGFLTIKTKDFINLVRFKCLFKLVLRRYLMKVKLINNLKIFRDTFPPYGLGVMNAFLNNNSIKSDIFDLDIVVKYHNSLGKGPYAVNIDYLRKNYSKIYRILKKKINDRYMDLQFERMLKKINLNDVDVVGINSHDSEIYISLYLAKKIKEKKDCTVVIGGSHALRLSYERMIYFIDELNINYVDYIVAQKPYNFFLKLDKGEFPLHNKKVKLLPEKKDIIKPNDEKFYKTYDFNVPLYNKEHLELYNIDIKKIKFFYPRLNKFLIDKFKTLNNKPVLVLPYLFTRGCINNCAFCFAGLQKPIKVDVDIVMSNIKAMQKKYKCNNFYFLNNNISGDKEYAIKLSKRLADETNIMWSDAASIKGLDSPTLKLMSDSGCIQLLFGLESASQRMLKYVHKNIDYNEIEYYTRCFKDCDKNNIWVVADVIAGFPYETEDDIKKSISYLDKNRDIINGVFVLQFIMFDNSPMYKNPKKYRLEIVGEEELRKKIISKFGNDVDVYQKIYYRNLPFNEVDTGLNWWEKQKQVRVTRRRVNQYIYKRFKTNFYVHYPIFYLYNAFDGDKKGIIEFLKGKL